MSKKLFLIRGLPGSGKSTLARQLAECHIMLHFEADQFFSDDSGNYNFDASKLGFAHANCQQNADIGLTNNISVVVSNTFTTLKELRPYFEIAKKHDIVPTVIHCQNQFKNVHDVPQEALDRMKSRFQHDISPLFHEFFPE
jgi:predicted kinase